MRAPCAYFEGDTGPEDVYPVCPRGCGEGHLIAHKEHGDLATSEAVQQVRFTATDLLRTTGTAWAAGPQALEETSGRASKLDEHVEQNTVTAMGSMSLVDAVNS